MEEYKGQPASKSVGLCTSQKNKIRSILQNDDLNMTRLVQEKAAIMRAHDAANVKRGFLYADDKKLKIL